MARFRGCLSLRSSLMRERTTRTLAFASALCAGAGGAVACGAIEPGQPATAVADAGASAEDADVSVVPVVDARSNAVTTCGDGGRAGSVDVAFGDGGFTTFDAQTGGACVAVDSKGRIYVVAETNVRRFNADGRLDVTYALGAAGGAARPACAVDAADRLLVIAGAALRRFDADGKPDTSFGTSGGVEVATIFGGEILPDLIIRPLTSGTIIVAGTSVQHELDATFHRPALTHLSASGAVLGQSVQSSGGRGQGALQDVDVDPVRGFVVALARRAYSSSGPFLAEYDFELAARTDFAPAYPDEQLRYVRRRADGKLLVVSDDVQSFRQLLPSGAADPTSPGDGGVGAIDIGLRTSPSVEFHDRTSMLALEDDSWILVGNTYRESTWGATLVHFGEDGSLDATFGDPSTSTYPGRALVQLGSDGDGGALHTEFRGAALDHRSVIVVAALLAPTATGDFAYTQRWAVVRVCR